MLNYTPSEVDDDKSDEFDSSVECESSGDGSDENNDADDNGSNDGFPIWRRTNRVAMARKD